MKNILRIIVVISIIIITYSCKEEFSVKEQDYPVILTKGVESISQTGITITAEIVNKKNNSITDVGFLWGEYNNRRLENSSKKSLGSIIENKIRAEISSDLCPNKVYFIRAYLSTEKYTFYGNEIVFTSKGSNEPVITEITPNESLDGTKVVITGENFSNLLKNNVLTFNDRLIIVDSIAENKIYFTTPEVADTGIVEISVNVGCQKSVVPAKFRILSPTISQIIPADAYNSDTIEIRGNYFNSDKTKNQVFLNDIQLKVLQSDANKIIALVPIIQPGNKVLKLKIGAKQIQKNYLIKTHWSRKSDVTEYNLRKASAFSINSTIFLGFGDDGYYPSNSVYKLNIPNNNWVKLGNFPGTARSYASCVAYNNRGYLMSGLSKGVDFNDFWEYNPFDDSWVRKNDLPCSARFDAVSYLVGDKLYFGLGDNYAGSPSSDFWTYDFTIKTWSQKPNFPGKPETKPFGFVIGSKIYFGFSDWGKSNEFWMYDTTKDTWVKLNDYPGKSRYGAASFSLGGYGYMGIGNSATKDFWKYDPKTDKWIQIEDYPGIAQAEIISVTAEGKAYIGIGMNYSFQRDFWEFTP